jgi:hypothetical protein
VIQKLLYTAAPVAFLIGPTMGHIPKWATLTMMLFILFAILAAMIDLSRR